MKQAFVSGADPEPQIMCVRPTCRIALKSLIDFASKEVSRDMAWRYAKNYK